MNDGMLSQDEIDALLKNTEDNEVEEESHDSTISLEDYLSVLEQDALGEIGNISFGSSATTLSTLLNQKVEITTPVTKIVNKRQIADKFPQPHVSLEVEYTEGFTGLNVFVMKMKDAAIIADLMMGGGGQVNEEDELSEISLSAIQEAMNQMMGTAATSMSTVFDKKVDISPPSVSILDIKENKGDQIPNDDVLVEVSFQLKIGNLIDSNIMQLLPISFARELVEQLVDPSDGAEEQKQTQQTKPVSNNANTIEQPEKTQRKQQTEEITEVAPTQSKYIGNPSSGDETVQTAAFSSFDNTSLPTKEKRNLDMLMDIPLKVTVELGRTQRTVKEILDLSSGSIIELDKLAGEPVDIQVNNKLIAKGEVVVIDENFGVRVTDIVSQSDRIKKLN